MALPGPQHKEVDGTQAEHNDCTPLKRQKLEFGAIEIVGICRAEYRKQYTKIEPPKGVTLSYWMNNKLYMYRAVRKAQQKTATDELNRKS